MPVHYPLQYTTEELKNQKHFLCLPEPSQTNIPVYERKHCGDVQRRKDYTTSSGDLSISTVTWHSTASVIVACGLVRGFRSANWWHWHCRGDCLWKLSLRTAKDSGHLLCNYDLYEWNGSSQLMRLMGVSPLGLLDVYLNLMEVSMVLRRHSLSTDLARKQLAYTVAHLWDVCF
jgi:hypothetical protein